jgi:hypothetical protein
MRPLPIGCSFVGDPRAHECCHAHERFDRRADDRNRKDSTGACDWDYKANYKPGADQDKAKDFVNFNFGAVLESLGFSYFFTQNAAGVAQIGICKKGGYCGVGIPGVVFPFGDSIDDAVNVKRGFDYQRRVDRGCTPQ